jgi:hypothetical protein
LQVECRAAGIAPAAITALIDGVHAVGEGRIAAPNLARLMKDILDDVAAMIRAVKVGEPPAGEAMSARLSAIQTSGLLEASNEIEASRIAKLTGVTEDDGDSLHRMVMDLHKALNRLARRKSHLNILRSSMLEPSSARRDLRRTSIQRVSR